jgi:hypothetical protein
MISKNTFLRLGAILAITACAGAHAATYTLDMSALPSTQGWVYNAIGNSVTETEIFSIVDNALHQNSTSVGNIPSGGNSYYLFDAMTSGLDWTLDVTARLDGEFAVAGYPNNHWGFSVAVFDPEGYEFGFGLGDDVLISGDGAQFSLDTSQIHNYRLQGRAYNSATPTFDLFVDGNLLTSGSASLYGCAALGPYCNSLSLGDQTGGPNGIGDYYSYSFAQVPVPASAWLLGSCLLSLGGLARRKCEDQIR